MATNKRGLGKGLNALFETGENDLVSETPKVPEKSGILEIDINLIKPNKNQPRKTFNDESLNELADSIKENGLIQPIIVSKIKGGYELIAGERRLKASRIAGLETVPAILKENVTKKQSTLFALLENIQREDLNPIDEAYGFSNLKEKYNATQEDIAKLTGKSRVYIANSLRLLNLSEGIKDLAREGKISGSIARSLLLIKDEKLREKLAKKAEKGMLTVRDIENIANGPKKTETPKVEKSEELKDIENKITKKFAKKTLINISKTGAGKLEILFYSKEELDDLIANILKE